MEEKSSDGGREGDSKGDSRDDIKSQDDAPARDDGDRLMGIRKNMRSIASTFLTSNKTSDLLLLSEPNNIATNTFE